VTTPLAESFEKNRPRLRAIAHRMLGSASEAEDAVQDSWLRLSRSDAGEVDNLDGWLTTVVARICLDMLRARKTREETASEHEPSEPGVRAADPERELLLADAVASAMTLVLDTLAPAERVAFVLHDLFGLSFGDVGGILERTPTAARQLASRARRRVQGGTSDETTARDAALPSQREVVDAFLAASRQGDFAALLSVLDPDVVLRVDPMTVRAAAALESRGAPKLAPMVRGAHAVAGAFSGRAGAAQPALLGVAIGAVWAPGGKPRAAFAFRIVGGKIVEVQLTSDPAIVSRFDIVILQGARPS
jgi:RNA polymerase sigma factor (sigma-70 family)